MQDLPLRLLGILAQHQGQVVLRGEIQRQLWPDKSFADFEDGLNTAIRKVRQALGDDPRDPTCIETIRGYGYRLLIPIEVVGGPTALLTESLAPVVPTAGPVEGADAVASGSVAASVIVDVAQSVTGVSAEKPATATRSQGWRPGLKWAGGLLAGTAAAFALWWVTPLPPPSPSRVLAITSSGKLDYCLRPATDGARLFFLERNGDHWSLMQTSMIGGEAQAAVQPFRSTAVFDVSPDGSQLLLGSFEHRGDAMQMWTMPVQGGPPVRVGDLKANEAAWSHAGASIAYVLDHELWIAGVDGSHARLVIKMPGGLDWPAWSPDDTHLRVTMSDPLTQVNSIWEIGVDGTGAKPFLPQWKGDAAIRYGTWSPDGKYYVFNSDHDGRFDVWALRERSNSWRRSPAGPFRLTDGPFQALGAAIAPDAKRVYFCGDRHNFQMATFDVSTKAVVPFLSQLNPTETEFSRDGQWLTYVGLEPNELWRSRADGSDRRKLVPEPEETGFPRWSPDGRRIAFTGRPARQPQSVYVINRDGGTPILAAPQWVDASDPDWSPDGKSVIASRLVESDPDKKQHRLSIVDLATRRSTDVPGGEGYWAARWSPAGGVIAATSEDSHQIGLFDVRTQQWRRVGEGKLYGITVWSPNGAYLYFQDLLAPAEPLFRVRPDGTGLEQVAQFSSVLAKDISRCALIGVTPEGRILVWLTHAESDLYAVELNER
jgi:Tol biopolymer transport system component/DNA-binding winged helix-turn-helix (wHTH) protein